MGDICVSAIAEIIRDFRVTDLITSNPEEIKEKGYFVYWDYVRGDFKNRVELQKRIRSWYKKNKKYLVWHVDNELHATSDDMDAKSIKHPAGGYYLIEEKKSKNKK